MVRKIHVLLCTLKFFSHLETTLSNALSELLRRDVQKGCHACCFSSRVLFCTRRRKTTAQHSPLSHPWMISLKGSRLRAFFGVEKSLRSMPKNHAHKGDVQKGCHACNFIARVLFLYKLRNLSSFRLLSQPHLLRFSEMLQTKKPY